MYLLDRIRDYYIYIQLLLRTGKDKSLCQFLNGLTILSSEKTIKRIIEENLSISRFGDGEFSVMTGGANGFQHKNEKLGVRLSEVLCQPVERHLVCIPYTLKDLSLYRTSSRIFALEYLYRYADRWLMPYLKTDCIYGDSLFTRFYMMRKDKRHCTEYVKLLKTIWNQTDLLIVEGKYSRLGVGNDLFDNANSIGRILCPNTDAFDKYEEILAATQKYGKGKLILLALGMTATVLAYDLARAGYRAIDVGHIDVEYMWMLMEAKEKCPIPGRSVNEVGSNMIEDDSSNSEYLNTVIVHIG